MTSETSINTETFVAFVAGSEQRLRRALIATYGPVIGREATVDALSWGWEHWARLEPMTNQLGYLYRVGQTAARRILAVRPVALAWRQEHGEAEPMPELVPALARLSEQQRAVVVLVHGYAFNQREVADLLEISASTVREHLTRAMNKLHEILEDPDEQ